MKGRKMDHVSEFKCLGFVLGEGWSEMLRESVEWEECFSGVIESLVNVTNLQLEYGMVLHECLFVSFFMYGDEKIDDSCTDG